MGSVKGMGGGIRGSVGGEIWGLGGYWGLQEWTVGVGGGDWGGGLSF